MHSFFITRIDYCSALYIGLPAGRIRCLERVLRSAARLVGHFRKFDHVSSYMHDVLHWLPLPQRIAYRVLALVWRCLLGLAPAYLRELCRSTQDVQGRRSLRSSVQANFLSPMHELLSGSDALSLLLALRPGMGSLYTCVCCPRSLLTHSIAISKLHSSAEGGSGALLSSYLEGALYKSL